MKTTNVNQYGVIVHIHTINIVLIIGLKEVSYVHCVHKNGLSKQNLLKKNKKKQIINYNDRQFII